MFRPSILISGASSALLLLLLASCFPYGFQGGGLDRSLKTFAVVPFENKTTTPGLERELAELLSNALRKMGRKEAPETQAHIRVTGAIADYDVDIPIAFSADPGSASGTRRKLKMSIDISIVAQTQGKTILDRKGLSAEGQYQESAEAEGRREALTRLVNDIVQGIQSQW